ncbi:MAG: cytochrome b/b6 domain-containing protein [Gemmatimonadota bacterium]|nr:cytochrome b/b6 domain-containing protein [Gemmatimonadota bacterium]
MEILRTAANPWGENILLGVAWWLIWAALLAGVAFVVVHAVYVGATGGKKGMTPGPAGAAPVPDKVERHSRSSRTYHWLMAASMLTLLVTAFFPLVGIQFAWVTIHWIAGVALTLLVLWHIYDSFFRQDWRAVWIGGRELGEMKTAVGRFFSRDKVPHPRMAKYHNDQRMFHHAASITGIGVIITGLLMMFRIDTWFWASNPYFLSDSTWGLVFVLHGLCGVGLITLVIAHIYFAIRPEKRWMTRSMIKGWITREEYLTYYDPDKWLLEGEAKPVAAPSGSGGTDAQGDPEAVAPA